MSKKKDHSYTKQHIVPKSYLNDFATSGDSKGKHLIGVRQKDLKHYITSTNNVGYMRDYYNIEFLGDKKKWEHFYDSEIEAPCLRTIKKLIARVTLSNFGKINLTETEKYNLSKFITAQFLRVPQFIDKQINDAQFDFFPNFKKEFLHLHKNSLSDEQKTVVKNICFTSDQIKHLILSYINDPNKTKQYCNILMSKPWTIYINGYYKYFPFITSDNPVVMTNLISFSHSRNDNGLGNRNTVIFFPINPCIAIGIYPQQFRLSLSNCKEVFLSEKDINFIGAMNECELSQCHNQAFIPVDYYNTIYEEVILQ